MAFDLISMALSKGYTEESLLGGGAVVGKNVTISSITPIECGNRVTFSYTLDDGTVKISTMDVMDGKDGVDGLPGKDGKDGLNGKDGQQGSDGIGISKIDKIGTVDLVDTYRITFTDDSTFDYKVKNGKDGTGGEGASKWSEISDKPFKTLDDTTLTVDENGKLSVIGGTGCGGEENKIDSISVNGTPLTPDENKNVNIIVPEAYDDTSLVNRVKAIEDDYAKTSEIPSLSGYATETYIDNKVSDYTKTVDLADVATTGSYNDLTDKPVIPDTYDDSALVQRVADIESDYAKSEDIPLLDGYAKTSEIPSKVSQLENDSNYLSSIPEEYVTDTELEAKGYLTEHQDISELVNKSHDHNNKTVIDKFSISDSGTLLFDGNEIKGGSGTAGKSAYEIAIDNGFVGTEIKWLESLKGKTGSDGTTPHIDTATKHWFIDTTDTGILAEGINGDDGITPHIGSNNNWYIGDIDTGILAQGTNGINGKDGKSIKSITKDENNNIIATFTDGTTQNIGQLSIDVQADFLTSDGFGNLRYYNGHFQYYDTSSSTWVDTSVTPSNVYIMNMTPQEMKKIIAVYDTDLGKYKLKFEEPDDTIIDGQVACIVEKVIIRRKLGLVPIDENDGDLVIEVKRKDFGTYKDDYYVDIALSPSTDDVWYYKAFPMSTTGFYNTNSANETNGIKCKNYNLYGFKLDQNESNPDSMITYLSDCDNKSYKSAKMNYTTDTFDYGDWGDVWFIKNLKPCMLKYDGTVDYELDKDDYTKKTDGTASDVANSSYGGNAMIGIPKVYWKIINNGDDTANIYISDAKIDDDFVCWSHIDNNGNEIDYCYMPIYNGSNVNSVLRSISGKAPITSQTATTEINYAKANNIGSDIIWYTELFNDRMLINLLLLLIGKSTNTQVIFGTGNNNSYVSTSNTGVKNTGTMNTKGLFWGNQDNKSGVKVFGMENWYGNIWRRIGGWINDKGTQKIKMTYGQSDGSTVDGYNETGSGYISIGNSTPSGTNGGYISKMQITNNGLIPTISSGSSTTYYCDGLWFNNSQVDYAVVGGHSNNASLVGALYSALGYASSVVSWHIGAALSCKPLA